MKNKNNIKLSDLVFDLLLLRSYEMQKQDKVVADSVLYVSIYSFVIMCLSTFSYYISYISESTLDTSNTFLFLGSVFLFSLFYSMFNKQVFKNCMNHEQGTPHKYMYVTYLLSCFLFLINPNEFFLQTFVIIKVILIMLNGVMILCSGLLAALLAYRAYLTSYNRDFEIEDKEENKNPKDMEEKILIQQEIIKKDAEAMKELSECEESLEDGFTNDYFQKIIKDFKVENQSKNKKTELEVAIENRFVDVEVQNI